MDNSRNRDIIYGFSSANDYPSLAITGQLASDLANSLAAPVTIQSGVGPNGDSCISLNVGNYCRFGDYFGAGSDPSSPPNVWVAGQYGDSAGSWSSFIAKMQVASFTLSSNHPSFGWTCIRNRCDPGLQSATLQISTNNVSPANTAFTLVYGCGSGSPACNPVWGVQPGTITIPAGQRSGTATLSVQPGSGQSCTRTGTRTDCYTYIQISAQLNGSIVSQTMLILYACYGSCPV